MKTENGSTTNLDSEITLRFNSEHRCIDAQKTVEFAKSTVLFEEYFILSREKIVGQKVNFHKHIEMKTSFETVF